MGLPPSLIILWLIIKNLVFKKFCYINTYQLLPTFFEDSFYPLTSVREKAVFLLNLFSSVQKKRGHVHPLRRQCFHALHCFTTKGSTKSIDIPYNNKLSPSLDRLLSNWNWVEHLSGLISEAIYMRLYFRSLIWGATFYLVNFSN